MSVTYDGGIGNPNTSVNFWTIVNMHSVHCMHPRAKTEDLVWKKHRIRGKQHGGSNTTKWTIVSSGFNRNFLPINQKMQLSKWNGKKITRLWGMVEVSPFSFKTYFFASLFFGRGRNKLFSLLVFPLAINRATISLPNAFYSYFLHLFFWTVVRD